jgi:hypothetical protein
MNVSRRGLLTGLVGLVVAPAIVRASSLMKVKAYVDPDPLRLGSHTNTWGEKLDNAFIDWTPALDPSGERIFQGRLVLMERASIRPITGGPSKQIQWKRP